MYYVLYYIWMSVKKHDFFTLRFSPYNIYCTLLLKVGLMMFFGVLGHHINVTVIIGILTIKSLTRIEEVKTLKGSGSMREGKHKHYFFPFQSRVKLRSVDFTPPLLYLPRDSELLR